MDSQIIKLTLAGLSLFFFLGCGSSLIVRTEPPEAKISIMPPGSIEPKEIGKSPVEVTDKAIMDVIKINPNSGAYYQLLVEKDGYDTERIMVPAARFMPLVTTLDIKMKSGSKEMRLASQMVQLLLNAQRFATKGEFDRAQVEIDKALGIDPNFTRAMTMRASIYFLQSRFRESLDWYEKALAIDNNLEEAVRMISELKKKVGNEGNQ